MVGLVVWVMRSALELPLSEPESSALALVGVPGVVLSMTTDRPALRALLIPPVAEVTIA